VDKNAASTSYVVRDALCERSPGSQPGGLFFTAVRKVLTPGLRRGRL
jgi:hypothetical protein